MFTRAKDPSAGQMNSTHGAHRPGTVGVLALVSALAAGEARAQAPPTVVESNVEGARLGWSVACAGDVNGDGLADVIAGAPGYSNGEQAEGAVFLYFGQATAVQPLGPAPSWSFEGGQVGAALGSSVASAGDVNGDGYGDVIVGSPGWDAADGDEGRALVFLGSPSGLQAAPAWARDGGQAGARFGHSVASSAPTAGRPIPTTTLGASRPSSFNDDAYSDVAIGAPGHDAALVDAGRVLVFHGGPLGLAAAPARVIDGTQALAGLGWVVAPAGWVDGDATVDLAIASPRHDGSAESAGRVQVHLGSATGISATASWSKQGEAAWCFLGGSVGPAGDVDGDGYWDLLVGTWARLPAADPDEAVGRVQLYRGGPSGLRATPAWTRISPAPEDGFGTSAWTAGLVNADGYFDVVIGAPRHEGQRGRIEVFHGSAAGLPASPSWTASPPEATAMAGCAVGTAGDLDGDGSWEIVAGAPAFGAPEIFEGAILVHRLGVPGAGR